MGMKTEGTGAIGVYVDYGAFEEVTAVTAGHGADMGQPGVQTQMMIKSGGNQLHGSLYGDYQNSSLQATNITGDSPPSNMVTARPSFPDRTSCASMYSNWLNTNPDPNDPGSIQLYDVMVKGCISRRGLLIDIEFAWSTNGYQILTGTFAYDVRDCTTGQLIWQKRFDFENPEYRS